MRGFLEMKIKKKTQAKESYASTSALHRFELELN